LVDLKTFFVDPTKIARLSAFDSEHWNEYITDKKGLVVLLKPVQLQSVKDHCLSISQTIRNETVTMSRLTGHNAQLRVR